MRVGKHALGVVLGLGLMYKVVDCRETLLRFGRCRSLGSCDMLTLMRVILWVDRDRMHAGAWFGIKPLLRRELLLRWPLVVAEVDFADVGVGSRGRDRNRAGSRSRSRSRRSSSSRGQRAVGLAGSFGGILRVVLCPLLLQQAGKMERRHIDKRMRERRKAGASTATGGEDKAPVCFDLGRRW